MKVLAWLILIATISLNVYGAEDVTADINRKAAFIDELITGEKLASLTVISNEESEGSPPEIKFYTKGRNLVAATIVVGHETWVSKLTVYYYDNESPMKYLRVITGRQKQPEREAILYGTEGKPLWQNVDTPKVDASDILKIFRTINSIRKSAAQY